MNATQLLAHFDRLSEAPGSVSRLRRLVLELAIRGKLVVQDDKDESATAQLKDIQAARALRVGESKPRLRKAPAQNATNGLPFPLPRGWAVAPLAELTDVLNGRAYAKNELLDTGTPVLRVGNLFTSKHWYYSNLALEEDKYCDAGDLIFSWSASFGPFIWTGPKVIYHYHIWKLRLHSEARLDKHYLYRFLLQQTQQIKDSGHGVSMVHMTKEKMEKLLVPVPPLAEQHRIVAKVDELMALCDQLEAAQQERERRRDRLAVASLQRLNQPAAETMPETQREHARFHLHHLPRLTTRPEHIKAMRQLFLDLAVRGKLMRQDSNDETATELLRKIQQEKLKQQKSGRKNVVTLADVDLTSVPFELPSGWAWARFPEVGTFGRGKSKHRPRNDSSLFVGGTHPLVQTGDVARSKGVIKTFTSKYNDVGLAQSMKWPAGTLCITIAANIADSGILSFDACFPDSVVGFKASPLFDSARYFEYFVRTAKANLLEFAPATAQKNINLEILNAVLIPLPPLAEQHRIIVKVDELMTLCDQLEAQLRITQTDSRRLLEAVLDAALVPA